MQATSDPVDIPSGMPSGGIPARNHKGERLLLFVGIIDILQSYRLVKKIEHTFKAMIHDGVGLSSICSAPASSSPISERSSNMKLLDGETF